MREIKFRAWNKIDGMREVRGIDKHSIYFDIDDRNRKIYGLSPSTIRDIRSEWELMQFTGLKDKNGTDIYEGDIVKFKSFHDDSYWTKKATYSGAAFYADYRLEDLVAVKDMFSVEVIGNIYQNPELLNN